MQQQRRNRVILGVLALGLLAGAALTAPPAQAVDAVGPYYAEPAWDQQLAPANRFVVLTNWGSQAVLDKETGLVWERTPSTINTFTWRGARTHCLALTTGTRKGWRLPTLHELASLADPSVAPPGPTLPVGHPFVNVQADFYLTATTGASSPSLEWTVFFQTGAESLGDKTAPAGHAWCVRGENIAAAY